MFNKKFNFIILHNEKNKKFKCLNISHLRNAEKIKTLGDGGCSTVYLYKCKEQTPCKCNKLFVVKQIINSDKFDKNIKKQIKKTVLKEYIINKILKHQNIIEIEGIDIDKNCLLYKYDESNDLLYYFNKDNYNSKYYFKYYIQIIDAVKYMHSLGIAHMDLKLENILYNPLNNKIKIIDFGHACFFKKGNITLYNRGIKVTEYYIPPEVWKGSYMSDKVDIWCCGILLYNFIYNTIPWMKSIPEKDEKYRIFREERSKNILSTDIFKHPMIYGYNYEDSYIILELFLMMFKLNYYERNGINQIYNKLLKITLE
jgi:serine/threonine protein kinase